MHNAAEGLPKIPAKSGVPNSWLVSPSGEVRELEGADQQSAGKIEEIATAWMKEIGDHLTWKRWEQVRESFAEADAAVEKGDWKAALKAYAEVDKLRKKVTPAVVEDLDARLAALNEKVLAAFATLKEDDADPKARHKAVSDLLATVRATLSTGYIPAKTEIEAWITENRPPK
jgi:lipopolysaccharide biosynthesis regulator YciM